LPRISRIKADHRRLILSLRQILGQRRAAFGRPARRARVSRVTRENKRHLVFLRRLFSRVTLLTQAPLARERGGIRDDPRSIRVIRGLLYP
jgi:hypothetical protein